MLNNNPIYDEIKLLLQKAQSEKEQGDLLLANNFPEGAVNRYYYCAYHIAQALLIGFGENPRTHTGMIQRFGLLAIDRKIFDKIYAKTLSKLFRAREDSDYTAITLIDTADVVELEQQLKEYISAITSVIDGLLKNLES